jgi:hypothetical protein
MNQGNPVMFLASLGCESCASRIDQPACSLRQGLNGNEVKRVIHVMINNDGNDGGGLISIWVLTVLSVDCAKAEAL